MYRNLNLRSVANLMLGRITLPNQNLVPVTLLCPPSEHISRGFHFLALSATDVTKK